MGDGIAVGPKIVCTFVQKYSLVNSNLQYLNLYKNVSEIFFQGRLYLLMAKKNSCKSSDVNHCGTGTFALLYVSAAMLLGIF